MIQFQHLHNIRGKLAKYRKRLLVVLINDFCILNCLKVILHLFYKLN